MPIPFHIFREYDIRGLIDQEIDQDFVHCLGSVLANYFTGLGHFKILLAYDTRKNSLEYHDILAYEMLENKKFPRKMEVISLGMVPTPCFYYASFKYDVKAGIMVTASHNDAPYNGFKLWVDQRNFNASEIKNLFYSMKDNFKPRLQNINVFGKRDVSDKINCIEIKKDYINDVCSNVEKIELSIVVDGSNGTGGEILCKILQRLGAKVYPLYCNPLSDFPNHPPNPSDPINCYDLSQKVLELKADLGICLDGDADRVVFIDKNGKILTSETLLAILAHDVLLENPKAKIVADVKCSQKLFKEIRSLGGIDLICPTGRSNVVEYMKKEGAVLGGEFSGHYFHAKNFINSSTDRSLIVDDGIYTAIKILNILQKRSWDLTTFPKWNEDFVGFEIYFYCQEGKKDILLKKAVDYFHELYKDKPLDFIDGIRVDFQDSWFLIRTSKTSSALTLRFEADSKQKLQDLINDNIQLLKTWCHELNIIYC